MDKVVQFSYEGEPSTLLGDIGGTASYDGDWRRQPRKLWRTGL